MTPKSDIYRPQIPDANREIRKRIKKCLKKTDLTLPAFLRKTIESGLSVMETRT